MLGAGVGCGEEFKLDVLAFKLLYLLECSTEVNGQGGRHH